MGGIFIIGEEICAFSCSKKLDKKENDMNMLVVSCVYAMLPGFFLSAFQKIIFGRIFDNCNIYA